MSGNWCVGVALFLLAADLSAVECQVREIASNWKSSELRRLPVIDVRASSVFGEEGGRYAAALAVDGSRGSKWVASVAASEQSPQWITLELIRPQKVSALALFGEAPGNDGVRDAQIQVATNGSGQFSTVGTVTNATSGRWLVTFTPVKTPAVRLLITRSGGVSTHTDVYEIELYGPPQPAIRGKELVSDCLSHCARQVERFLSKIGGPTGGEAAPMTELRRAIVDLQDQQRPLAAQLARWNELSEIHRQSLVREAERLELRIHRLGRWLAVAESVPDRRPEIEAARREAQELAAGQRTTQLPGKSTRKHQLANDHILLNSDETENAWDATWLGGIRGGVRRVQFAMTVDGKHSCPALSSAKVEPFTDRLGSGKQLCQRSAGDLRVERVLRLYENVPAVVISGSITNGTSLDVKVDSVTMVTVAAEQDGWWSLGRAYQSPAAVGYPGGAPPCRPEPELLGTGLNDESYGSSGVVALAYQDPRSALVLGFASAQQGAPSVRTGFRPGFGGTTLSATSGLGGRVLPAGQTLSLDSVWLAVEEDPYSALEHYGNAVASLAHNSARIGANSLWCSWYPIRMGISEEVVLANAAVAATHFRPLGFDVIQLDHGWQRGDICGEWEPNERFPHGLAWLARELQKRHGMKLGLWIAPTVVNSTSQLFRDHPDWLLKGPDGKPARTGRWFWAPNPDSYVLDASHPAARHWLQETFRRLSGQGASYYKIDFIAGSGGSYRQHDPQCTRGWGVLQRGMEAIRQGAGPNAWIRYCQTPPLLSVGLANSAYIGMDTGDAGLANGIDLLRKNAPLLAASFWINDRLYHREVCDMSVGMKASVEEARLRLALMTLTGCSISFSDDFRLLELARIRLMQQCLPPGNPPARPLDLFQRRIPRQWHLHCANDADQWDVVGLFNFADQPQQQTVSFAALGLSSTQDVAVYEFWQDGFLGCCRDHVTFELPPQSSRILILRRLTGRPQVIGTDMHVLAGYHELTRLAWDDASATLSGQYRRAPGLTGKAYLYVPAGYRPRRDGSLALKPLADRVWVHGVDFKAATVDWSIRFDRDLQ